MTGSGGLWNEDQLLTEMEKMQDQIDSLMGEKDGCKQEALQRQQTISELSSQVSLLKNELQKKAEKIEKLNGADLVLAENEKLKKMNRDLILKEEGTRKEAEALVRNCKDEYSRKEERLKIREGKLETQIVSVSEKEKELDQLIRQEARNRTSSLQRRFEKETREMKRAYDRNFRRMRTIYGLLFGLACIYGIMVTILTAYKSEVICMDANLFVTGIGKSGIAFVSGVNGIAAFFAGIAAFIPFRAVGALLYGLIYALVTLGIYGGLILLIGFPVIRYLRFFFEKQADELSLFMVLLCITYPVFFGEEIKRMVSMNLVTVMLLLTVGCMAARGIWQMDNKEIRKNILLTVGGIIGTIASVILIIRAIGIGGLIGVPAGLLILNATDSR